ncbi:hypothetical protein Hesp01_63230 [Herbidospora sp. NBRC 101105]|nr:hypothetical protein Hesp01_63230 [Herbidospora sp. NBRC 101105]
MNGAHSADAASPPPALAAGSAESPPELPQPVATSAKPKPAATADKRAGRERSDMDPSSKVLPVTLIRERFRKLHPGYDGVSIHVRLRLPHCELDSSVMMESAL